MAQLTHARLHEALEYDASTGVFTWRVPTSKKFKPGDVAGTEMDTGYCVIVLDGKRHRAHRLAWFYVNGVWPSNDIDHIDRNRLSNAIHNLRDVSRSVNLQNIAVARSDSTSGLKGAIFHRASGRWHARVMVDGKTHSFGYHDTPEAAHAVYLRQKKRLHEGYVASEEVA